MPPRQSAIVAVANYNGAPYVARTVRSVLAQRDVDVRVLLVDNVSRDDSVETVRALDDPRVSILEFEEHLPVTANWNRALELLGGAASGAEFAALLHSDDMWEPEFLATAISRLVETGADVALGNTQVIDGEDTPVDRRTYRRKQRTASRRFEPTDRERLLAEMDIFPCSWVARSTYLAERRFDERFTRAPDWEFWIRAFEEPASIVSVPEAWSCYRIHGSNDTFTPATLRGMREDELRIVDEALDRLPVSAEAERRARRMIDVRMAIRSGQVLARGDWRTAGSLVIDMYRLAGLRGLVRGWFGLAALPETRLAMLDAIRSMARRRPRAGA